VQSGAFVTYKYEVFLEREGRNVEAGDFLQPLEGIPPPHVGGYAVDAAPGRWLKAIDFRCVFWAYYRLVFQRI
jgi:hypothetical protein